MPALKTRNDLVYWNVESLNREKITMLEFLFREYHPLFFGLCECKHTDDSMLSFPGFTLVSKPYRHNSGGLLLGISDRVGIHQRRQDLEQSYPHILWVECSFPGGLARRVLVGVCYRRPGTNSAEFEQLLNSIRSASATGMPIILGGDFNCTHSDWTLDPLKSDSLGGRLVRVCTENELHVLNSSLCPGVPTRPISGAVIDLVIASNPEWFADLWPDEELGLVSDHSPLLLKCALQPAGSPEPNHRLVWRLHDADWALYGAAAEKAFSKELARLPEMIAAAQSDQMAVDDMNATFVSTIHAVAKACLQQRRISNNSKPWWSAGLKACYEHYREARQRWLRTRSLLDRNEYWQRRNLWRKAHKSAVSSAASRASRVESLVNGKTNVNWKEVFPPDPSQSCNLSLIEDPTGELPASPTDGANLMAKHFAGQCASPDPAALISQMDYEILEFADNGINDAARSSPPLLQEKLFTLEDIGQALANLKNSAQGHDGINAPFLRNLPVAGQRFLAELFNFSWRKMVIPKAWKQANITPILKSRSLPKRQCNSYRPISLTSITCKTMERLVLPRLWSLAGPHISRFQAGFRKHQSTLNHLFRVYSSLSHHLNSPTRRHVSAAFLDIKSAFDSVWIPGLLWKLNRVGIRGRILLWLRSFLTERSIRVAQPPFASDWFPISAGVPQGSVLSPFLFLVFINDIEDCAAAAGCDLALFADDVAAWPRLHSQPGDLQLQMFLDLVSRWASDWKMRFGHAKSQIVVFAKREPPDLRPFWLSGFALDFASYYKYLGVIFESDLRWRRQTEAVIGKVNAVAALIGNLITPGQPPGIKTILTLIKCLLVPVILYGLPVWQPVAERINALDQLLCRPVRRCLSLPQASTHALSVLVDCGLLSVASLLSLAALRFACAILKMDAEDPCKNFFFDRRNQIAALCRKAATDSGLPLGDTSALKSAVTVLLRCEHNAWLYADAGPSILKGLKVLSGTSVYLLQDCRQVQAIRARLRHNRASLAESLHQRRVVDSPLCPDCLVPESVEHCLCACPRLDPPRLAFGASIAPLGLSVSLDTLLLGDLVPRNHRLVLLRISADFLSAADSLRRL